MSDFHKYVVSRSKSGGKFWEVEVEGCDMRTRYGKIGQEKSWSSKTFPTPEKALAEGQKKLRAKMGKGYVEEMEAWDLAERVDAMLIALQDHDRVTVHLAERALPVTDDEVAAVHARIGYELDPRFLAFFRVCNGLRVLWTGTTKLDDDPIMDYMLQREQGYACGSINVPSLDALFTPSSWMFEGPKPNEYQERLMGGWDSFEIRSHMRGIDDFLENPRETSYYLPALVAHPRYPDPPVTITDDYAAAIGDRNPMLARHYLELIVATLGGGNARYQAISNRGFGGNHPLFVPKDSWLDGFPSAQDMIDYHQHSLPRAKLDFILAQLNGIQDNAIDLAGTDYAAYNEPPAAPPMVLSEDPSLGMRRRERGDGGEPFPDAFAGETLTWPTDAALHYGVREPLEGDARTVEAARALLGEPVKFVCPIMDAQVGCLISVTDDGAVTLYHESEGAHGTVSSQLGELSVLGRAWRLVEA